jgi:hypothetical protein
LVAQQRSRLSARQERWGRGMKIYLLLLLITAIVAMANLPDWRKWAQQDRT